MTESIIYQQRDNSLNIEHFAFQNLILQQKPTRRPSFSTLLLQKKRTIMGRSQSKLKQFFNDMTSKEQLYYHSKKPELEVFIPFNDKRRLSMMGLERNDSLMTSSSTTVTDEDEGPKTPTTSSMSSTDTPNELRTVNLETAVTTPPASTTLSTTTLTDYPHGRGYSNFYVKLPSGKWMVRIRDANRKIVGTFEIDGSMI
ncbi:MAG: hypothetical protein EXX96DRAFT_545872 [Benjaminiella poitrasii]|nr:MAG: hypothetical protein EXX96DRAFT_545872 [Benjaminiella poitrasii]